MHPGSGIGIMRSRSGTRRDKESRLALEWFDDMM
jgi:hypothetical protein